MGAAAKRASENKIGRAIWKNFFGMGLERCETDLTARNVGLSVGLSVGLRKVS